MNMIFNASAGTGKTWRVTELYSALVLGGDHEFLPPNRRPVPPEKILLMTFTDNAAAELRGRVSQKMIDAEAAAPGIDDERADRARRVLRSLPAAHISTIHAFCAGLLREYALELGLSPAFQTLEDEARDALLDEVLKVGIFQCLENDADFRDFCSGVSVLGENEYSVLNTIRSLLEKAAGRGLDLSDAEAMLPPLKRTVFRQSFERIRDELASFDLPKTAADALDALNAALADFPNPVRIAALPKFGQAKKVKPLSDALAELKERFLTEYFYEQNIGKFRAFARCLAACSRSFSEAKQSRDCVDFGDQLLLARDLLKHRKSDEPLFDWIIVDEVQDTSRVQCDIIEALWTRDTHLVICGDKKQSIYAWRSADPGVMPDLEKQMAARGELRQIALKQSYRSKDRVLEAVNELFSGLYADYERAALEPVEAIGAVTAGETPCVEFLMQDDDESTIDDEMSAVARRIRLLVDGGAEWCPRFGHNGKFFVEGEPVCYGDILILLKRSTHQPVLEKALRDAGVPFTSGGKGGALFNQQEVRDLLLFLQVLCEPFNDLALVGFLRSPFADVPDDELVRLAWNGETFGREILRKQFFESGSAAAERLLRYRSQTGEKLPSQLVREIVRETAFDAQLAGQPGGAQKLANFKKTLDWIRGAERGGQVLLPDVVRRFEKYIKTPPRSGAAEALLPDPSQNAVTLMTVHSAKGLTKRVCFVPDSSFGEVTEAGFAMFSSHGTLELNITGLTGEKVKSPGWDEAREADKEVRKAELTNLFYVAMTRARDLAVFSGAGTNEPKGWLKMAEAFIRGAAPEILRTLRFADLPEFRDQRPEVGGQNSEVEVGYAPPKIPDGIERRTVTSLVGHSPPAICHLPSANSSRYGTAGHAVLEELAKNNWTGDIPKWVSIFADGLNKSETGLLIKQLAAARAALQKETAGATALFAEWPFVLNRGRFILDGTIDLLVQTSSGDWKILDYKFTNADPAAALECYAPQMAVYQEAVEKLYPGAGVSVSLVLIGDSATVVEFKT
ncbi:MAG: UvrD-helicase domain-containing protein [Pontiellaceae bacterium]|jgi:ATP-dependent helicase/nuclease subunit A|nr:UvrD-helicase domain-containing protein [Pontiellaceae bacterium]